MPETEGRPQGNVPRGWDEWADPLGEYERHPATVKPPPYPDAKLEALKRGTAELGQQYNVEVLPGPGAKRWVVRGWHMLRACRELKAEGHDIEPRVAPPDRELRTDDDVRVYTAQEGAGRHWNASLMALWTKEVYLPDFRAKAAARMAGDAAALEDEERGQAIALACRETRANSRYVKDLNRIERTPGAEEYYARVRAAILAGDPAMNVNKAKRDLDSNLDDEGVYHEPDPSAAGSRPPRQQGHLISFDLLDDLRDVKDELDVATYDQAIEALVQFRDAEPEAWARFLAQWREARERP